MAPNRNRKRQVLLVAGVLATFGVSACNAEKAELLSQETQIMSNAPTGSQPAAPEIEPIEHEGIRYEEDKVNSADGDQNGGYLAAFDLESGAKLWRLKVYEVANFTAHGVENIGIYFRSMQMLPDGDVIEVVNTAGTRYRVKLADRTSTYVDGPAPGSADVPKSNVEPKPKPKP